MTKTTPMIPIDDIFLGERFRKDYGEIDQLAHSIRKNGLISPIAVGISENLELNSEEKTDLPYTLMAGGRRMRALRKLGWKMVPAHIYEQSLSELDFRSIELAENFDRKEMEYMEEVALMREINNLQTGIHGPKISRDINAPGWSQADTARLLGKSPSAVTKDIQLAEAIEKHPELQLDKCKNKTEAFRRLKNVGKILSNIQQSTQYQNSISDKTFKKLSSSYIIRDCFETFEEIPANSLDFIEIDPPYGIDLHKIKKDNDCFGYNEIDAKDYENFMKRVFAKSYRVLRENSWLICWFAMDPWFHHIFTWLQDAGFKLKALPGTWIKPQGQTASPETYLANSYEVFFYARKGRPKIQKPGYSNVFPCNLVPHTKKYHPTQRPLELMKEIYSTFCHPGTNGYIPFLGSGVGLLAGHSLSMNMIGTDRTSTYKDGYIIELKEFLQNDQGSSE